MKVTQFTYFADWMGMPVFDRNNKILGRVFDLFINTQETYPPVTTLVIQRGRLRHVYAEIPWSEVTSTEGLFRIKNALSHLNFKPTINTEAFRVRRDILDQQVVDLHNHKVIRVNDVHMLPVTPPRIVHVDIGTRGLIRRLGWENIVDRLIHLIKPQAAYLRDEHLVSWKYVKTVSTDPLQPIQMDLTARQLESIPPADLGDLIMDLDVRQRVALFRTADVQQRARLFERLDFEQQEQLLEHLNTREAVDLLSKMSADEAVDLLGGMASEQSRQLLALMESSRARRLSQLLGYEDDEAGGLMTTEYLEVPETYAVYQALDLVKDKIPQLVTIYYLYVVNESKKLIGSTTLRSLIGASPRDSVMQTIFPKPVFVYTHTPIKEVAFLMEKYKVSALPVVNKEKILQGIITVDDVLHHVIPIAWRRRSRKTQP